MIYNKFLSKYNFKTSIDYAIFANRSEVFQECTDLWCSSLKMLGAFLTVTLPLNEVYWKCICNDAKKTHFFISQTTSIRYQQKNETYITYKDKDSKLCAITHLSCTPCNTVKRYVNSYTMEQRIQWNEKY